MEQPGMLHEATRISKSVPLLPSPLRKSKHCPSITPSLHHSINKAGESPAIANQDLSTLCGCPPGQRRRQERSQPMPHYVVLYKFTDQGMKDAKGTIQRAREAQA